VNRRAMVGKTEYMTRPFDVGWLTPKEDETRVTRDTGTLKNGYRDGRRPRSRPHRFIAPAIEQRKESILIYLQLLGGWRSTPVTIPATNELHRLNSTMAINVVSTSRAIRDRLRVFRLALLWYGGLRRSVYIRHRRLRSGSVKPDARWARFS
jgi:hypothetical protein